MLSHNIVEHIIDNVWINIYRKLLVHKVKDSDRKLIANEISFLLELELNNIDETERKIIREQREGIEEVKAEQERDWRESR